MELALLAAAVTSTFSLPSIRGVAKQEACFRRHEREQRDNMVIILAMLGYGHGYGHTWLWSHLVMVIVMVNGAMTTALEAAIPCQIYVVMITNGN